MNESTGKLVEFYEKILEAERAGVQTIKELLNDMTDQDSRILASAYLLDEGMNCSILSNLIKNAGGTPGTRTGDFVEKVRALNSIKEKLELLAKGQEWVVKQIRYNREILFPASARMFMESIKIQHEENVDKLKNLIKIKYPD